MKRTHIISFIALLTVLSGCYMPITGRVIDAETNQPIEGAVVLVEWTKRHGFGEYWTESFKVVEAVSDKAGVVHIEGCNSPFVSEPHMAVYKKGYVVWSNEYQFPNYEKREGFQWKSELIFKLDKFKSTYSYIEHQSFVGLAIRESLAPEKKGFFLKAYDDAEKDDVIRERALKTRK